MPIPDPDHPDPPDEDQPLDSDRESARSERPPHHRIGHLLVVWLGGALGTAARYRLGRVLPQPAHLPLPIFMINIAGAFVLGVLLARLAGGGPDRGRRRVLRLAIGTGFCGGFTTYSALAVDTVTLGVDGRMGWGIGYALLTLVVGLAAAAAGLALGDRRGAVVAG